VIITEDKSDGQDTVCKLLGSRYSASSLKTGEYYYAQNDGSISIQLSDYRVGKALSSTELVTYPTEAEKWL